MPVTVKTFSSHELAGYSEAQQFFEVKWPRLIKAPLATLKMPQNIAINPWRTSPTSREVIFSKVAARGRLTGFRTRTKSQKKKTS